jgi:hypothetical protein
VELPSEVPQFAQNFALSGFANPQFGHVILSYCIEPSPPLLGFAVCSTAHAGISAAQ